MARLAVAASTSEREPRGASPPSSRPAIALIALALVAYGALAFGYIRLTPPWQNPDEPAHVNYVAFVATTGGLPVLQPGDWDSGLLERLKTGTLQPSDDISAIRYESWQPPLFYVLAAPLYRMGSPETAPYRLRVFDAVLGALTLLVAYLAARQVLTPLLAATVPLAITGVPMFTAVSASASADPLANLFAAALVLALLRGSASLPREEFSPGSGSVWAVLLRPPLLLGALLGLGLLTKLELAIFVPLALGVIAIGPRRSWREALIVLVTAALVTSPWLVHQVTSYGWTDPFAIARHSAVVTDQPRFPGLSPTWLAQFATVSFHSFWAQFGWMAVVAPDRLYLVWGALTLLAAIGLSTNAGILGERAWQLLLATAFIAILAFVGYNLSFVQFQGRYLFTALVPIAILLVRGWSAIPPRPWASPAIALALVALNAYALLRVLVPGFAPNP